MIPYDPTKAALLEPQSRPPLCGPGAPWPAAAGKHALCAELSRLAYFQFESDGEPGKATETRVAAALAGMGLGDPGFHSDAATGTQYFTAISADGLDAYLAFRGTEPRALKDLLSDAKAVPLKWQGQGKVHWGFRDALPEPTWSEILGWADQHKARQIWLTGHSLGAALATLCAARIPRANLVNFGSPSVGDQDFVDSLANRTVARYVDCSDLVARVPPAKLGYRHLPGERYIDRHGVLDGATSAELTMATLAKLVAAHLPIGLRPGNVALRQFADHAPINYLRALYP